MLREGHVGISLIVALPIQFLLVLNGHWVEAVVVPVSIIFGGGVPDIDTKISVFTHRGFTHTVWFAVIFGVLCSAAAIGFGMFAYGQLEHAHVVASQGSVIWVGILAGIGVTIGVLSHLLGDLITPRGVRPFRPVDDRKYKLPLTNASNRTSNLVAFVGGQVSFVFVTALALSMRF